MNSEIKSDLLRQYLLLRTIIGALGERATPPWWRTQFLTDFGLRTLARVFPRTPIYVALDSVFAAARLEHDRRVGLGKRYHLFRLPRNVERAMRNLISDPTFSAHTTTLVGSGQKELFQELNSIADGHRQPALDGPIALGSITKLTEPAILTSLAAHYANSVSSTHRPYPYFSEVGERP